MSSGSLFVDERNQDGVLVHRIDHFERRRLHAEHHAGDRNVRFPVVDGYDVFKHAVGQRDGAGGAGFHVQPGTASS